MLEGFKVVNLVTGLPSLSITKNGVAVNKPAVIKLEYSPKVYLLIDEQGKRLAVQKCEVNDDSATSFYKNQKSTTVRWNNSDLLNQIQKVMNWDLNKSGYRVTGDFLEEDKALIFDLKNAASLDSNTESDSDS